MRLCEPHDVPRYGVENTYRHPRATPLLVFAASAAFMAGWTLFMHARGSSFVLYLPALAAAVVAGYTLAGAWAAFRSSNWLLKSAQDGLYIQFRSFLNRRLPDDGPTVVHFPPTDIEGVRVTREQLTLPNRDGGDMITTLTFIDIVLHTGDTAGLREALRRERTQVSATAWRGATHLQFPVRIPEPNVIRIHWTAQTSADRAADYLSARYGRLEDKTIIREPWHALEPEGQEALIVDLCERGEVVTAMRLAQLRYDLNAREARRFVKELMRGPLEETP